MVQSYELISGPFVEIVARFLPWLEFILGVFLVVGLWLKIVLRSLMILMTVFLVTVSQALLRNLPIHECGCFGELFSAPLPLVLVMDSFLLLSVAVLKAFMKYTFLFSLDHYFIKHK